MQDFDKIIIQGRVGRDPSAPVISSLNFVTFSVAVDKHWQAEPNVWQKKTKWYSCNTSDHNIAQKIMDEVKKGCPVYVEGMPSINSYKNHQGVMQNIININIKTLDGIRILTSKPKNNDFVKLENKYNKTEEFLIDDDIPF
jgi:single stranded DNA-binding protein